MVNDNSPGISAEAAVFSLEFKHLNVDYG